MTAAPTNVDTPTARATRPERADRRAWSRYTQQAGLVACILVARRRLHRQERRLRVPGQPHRAAPRRHAVLHRRLRVHAGARRRRPRLLHRRRLRTRRGDTGLLMTHGIPWPLALLGGIGRRRRSRAHQRRGLDLPRRAAADRDARDVLRRRRHRRRHHRRHRRLRLSRLASSTSAPAMFGGIPYLIFYAVDHRGHLPRRPGKDRLRLQHPRHRGQPRRRCRQRRSASPASTWPCTRSAARVAALAGILGAARLSTASPSAGGAA